MRCVKSVHNRRFSGPHCPAFGHSYLSVFSPNAGKYGPEKLRIRTLFTQWWSLSSDEIQLGMLMKSFCFRKYFMILSIKAYSEPSQSENFILDVWQDSEYTSELSYVFHNVKSYLSNIILPILFIVKGRLLLMTSFYMSYGFEQQIYNICNLSSMFLPQSNIFYHFF